MYIALHMSVLALGLAAQAPAAPAPAPSPVLTASVEQCVPSASRAERSATFAAQMTAVAGTQRMAIQVEVQERPLGEVAFHTVLAPGLGTWRESEPGVRIYKYVKQVTNLAAPAAFRAEVHYRWLDGRGRTIKRAQRRTPVCLQRATR